MKFDLITGVPIISDDSKYRSGFGNNTIGGPDVNMLWGSCYPCNGGDCQPVDWCWPQDGTSCGPGDGCWPAMCCPNPNK